MVIYMNHRVPKRCSAIPEHVLGLLPKSRSSSSYLFILSPVTQFYQEIRYSHLAEQWFVACIHMFRNVNNERLLVIRHILKESNDVSSIIGTQLRENRDSNELVRIGIQVLRKRSEKWRVGTLGMKNNIINKYQARKKGEPPLCIVNSHNSSI